MVAAQDEKNNVEYVGVLMDITAAKQAEEALQELQAYDLWPGCRRWDNPTGLALPQVPERQRAQWFRAQATDGRSGTGKTMIVALARKLGVEITNRS